MYVSLQTCTRRASHGCPRLMVYSSDGVCTAAACPCADCSYSAAENKRTSVTCVQAPDVLAWLLQGCQEATGDGEEAKTRRASCTAASRELYHANAELSGPGLPVLDYGDSTAAAVPPEMLQQVCCVPTLATWGPACIARQLTAAHMGPECLMQKPSPHRCRATIRNVQCSVSRPGQ